MLLRHAVPLNIKILQGKIDYSGFEKIKDELNNWFVKQLVDIKKPIKSVKLIGHEYDMGKEFGVGISIELED